MTTVLTRGCVAFPGSSLDYNTGSWRDHRPVHTRQAAPCHAQCPAGEDPQAYIALAQEGRLREAWERLVSANPLPAVTGRICPHPCETACNRGQYDAPLTIHAIERYLGDEAIAKGWPYPVAPLPPDALSVAIVGAGPSGISAAYHLLRLGVRPTLYDQYPEAGGLLRAALPLYRLPRNVLDAEISRILALGIAFRPSTRLGRDVELSQLREEYAAVYMAPGCHKHRAWSVGSATPSGLREGLEIVKEWVTLGQLPAAGQTVVVHGGGNTAIDAARLLRRGGAKTVHVVTASALPDDTTAPPEDRMNALVREVEQAREEGVIFHPHRTLTRLVLREGRVTAVEMAAVRKLRGDLGHTRRVAFEGTETVIPADQVVPAIGETVEGDGFEALLAANGFIAADAHGATGVDRVFAGGDCLGHEGTVTAAVGDGRRAAEAIRRSLLGLEQAEIAPVTPIEIGDLHLRYFDHATRAEPPTLPVSQREGEAEIEGSLTTAEFHHEVQRCFSCGDCLACDNCWTFCPDTAVLKTAELASDGSHYVFDYAYCKGCGLCAAECPTGYIQMIEEPLAG